MTTLFNITTSESKTLNQPPMPPSDTLCAIKMEDNHTSLQIMKRQKALAAMNKLKGSGNGCLVNILLKER